MFPSTWWMWVQCSRSIRAPPVEYNYCPESFFSLPLRDRLLSLSLNGPGAQSPDDPSLPSHVNSWGSRAEAAFTVTGSSLTHRAESPHWQAGNLRPVTCGVRCLCVCNVCVRENEWICDTKSHDSMRRVMKGVRKGVRYVRFPEIPDMEECKESGLMLRFVGDETLRLLRVKLST